MTEVDHRLLLNFDNSKRIFIRDPIDGSRVFRNDSREMLFNWCFEHCQGRYWIGMGFGVFENDEDATVFTLRWA